MRTKFEQQYFIGQKLIEDTQINNKCRDAFPKLILALKELYTNTEYNTQIFKILEKKIINNKKRTGRKGLNLWQIFVLAQTRLCLNISYDRLHHMANYDSLFRQIMGIETESGFPKIELEYQNIIDNVKLLDDESVKEINDVIVEFGHSVFKKKETEALCLKTDSFVVKSNVHYPTDYNLLWDSGRKCIAIIEDFTEKYPDLPGWRNLKYWYRTLKNKMRELSQAGRKKEEVKKKIAEEYLKKAKLFMQKLKSERDTLPLDDVKDLALQIELDYYVEMLEKHIDLTERRIIKGETIAHSEKIFSIFEVYTEWISKGKRATPFELGKNVQITSDQFHLIIDHKIMEHEVDKSSVISLSDRILCKYQIKTWSFDKGFYTKENKELLGLYISNLIMPKKGKCNKAEKEEEQEKVFKKYRNKHSAVESNINELEYRGLDRCPDRGHAHFRNYIALGISAYNLHKIGSELRRQALEKKELKTAA